MKSQTFVPAAPFVRLLNDMDEDVAAERIGVSRRRIYQLQTKPQERMEFSLADRIVTYTVGPMAWWEDEELNAIYMAVDLEREDILNPIRAQGPIEYARQMLLEAMDIHKSTVRAAKSLRMSPSSFSFALRRAKAAA